MSSKLVGDWKKFERFCANFGSDVKSNSSSTLKEGANDVLRDIQKNIQNAEGMTPLKPKTIAKKGHNDILYETGTLLNSIELESIGDNKYVVSPKGSHPSGLSNSELAMYHEYGTDVVPSRPFIKPTYEELKPKIEEDMANIVSVSINKYT